MMRKEEGLRFYIRRRLGGAGPWLTCGTAFKSQSRAERNARLLAASREQLTDSFAVFAGRKKLTDIDRALPTIDQ